jgi:hypothetical protein
LPSRIRPAAEKHAASFLSERLSEAQEAADADVRNRGVHQPKGGGQKLAVPPEIDLSGTGAGRPLPAAVQQKMEPMFGTSFDQVRVHVGPEAASIGARAFTTGSRIHFAPGLYAPHTAPGRRLLGHELAHVAQQEKGRVRNPYGRGSAVVQDPGLEAEADRLGNLAGRLDSAPNAMAGSGPARPAARAAQAKTGVVQCTKDDALSLARALMPDSKYSTYEQVEADKSKFTEQQWQDILTAYSRAPTAAAAAAAASTSDEAVAATFDAAPASSSARSSAASASTSGAGTDSKDAAAALPPPNFGWPTALSKDLDNLATPGNWAYTGSFATFAWAFSKGIPARQPNDIDILVADQKFGVVAFGLQDDDDDEVPFKFSGGAPGTKAKFARLVPKNANAPGSFKVDVLRSGGQFGTLNNVTTLDLPGGSFPVVPIDVLISRKEAILEDDGLGPQDIEKAGMDLEFLKQFLL